MSDKGFVLKEWAPTYISILTLLFNILFCIFVQPKLSQKARSREVIQTRAQELLNYLAEVVSLDKFDGVKTKIRQDCQAIKLQFKDDKVDTELNNIMEQIFQDVDKRKQLSDDKEIEAWENKFLIEVRTLRRCLSKYCGGL